MTDTSTSRRPAPARSSRRLKFMVWAAIVIVLALLAGGLFWRRHFHHYTPLDAMRDLQAASQVGHTPHPVERFLELRYGPQTDPANRETAIRDFFNSGHIEGLYRIIGTRTDPHAKALVAETAQIVATYRQMMQPADKAELGAYFRSEAGRQQLREATDAYQSKDVRFRAVTTPVIQELMTTLTAVQ